MAEQSHKASTEVESQPVIVGRIAGLYGVRGWVRIVSYTEPMEGLLQYRNWLLNTHGLWRPRSLAESKKHGKSVIARFSNVEDRDAAAELLGSDIAVARRDMPPPGPGEFYWADLEGLEVRHRDGRVLGRVARMLATGANDVMVVQANDKEKREVLIPFVPDLYVLSVDLASGVIDVDWEWD